MGSVTINQCHDGPVTSQQRKGDWTGDGTPSAGCMTLGSRHCSQPHCPPQQNERVGRAASKALASSHADFGYASCLVIHLSSTSV